MSINLHLGDCLEAMRAMPDNSYDLAIVDPPYGIGASKVTKKPHNIKQKNGSRLQVKNNNYKPKDWDALPPNKDYFIELKRISKNQIVFGVNYYNTYLGSGRIVWDKLNWGSDQQDAEIAYTSFHKSTRIVRYMWHGMFQGYTASNKIEIANRQMGNKSYNEKRIHPTQKPVKLYEWLLDNYAKEGDRILDTHLGSGSIALACHNRGFSLDAYEIDEEYYNAATERLRVHQSQLTIF